jgi:metallophosphoesterase (TIGR00282 family)
MNLLYIGDIMGPLGITAVEKILPELKKAERIDVVIAQSENVSGGKGLSITDYQRLRDTGIDGFTGGNWSVALPETNTLMTDPNIPVTGPANMHDCPGPGFKYVSSPKGRVLIISLLGKIVGRDADKPTDNPLTTIDKILESQKEEQKVATVVNFHGDYSSEKIVIGHYLDGQVSLLIGDHWHVQTADAMLLPGSTAYQTDAGMCGSLDSSLGVKFDAIIPRWRDGIQNRNELETAGRSQFNATLVRTNDQTGLAEDVKPIRQVW